MNECIFCKIINKEITSTVVLENSDFIAIENINPKSPVHILVIPKKHISKQAFNSNIWSSFISFSFEVVRKYGLDKTGYRFVNNGAGYNQIEHEHLHIMGGKGWVPLDDL